ncbi:MAG: hypothetical protein HUU19_00980 [Phycisphaerales bacterium]|nr:hypothetical protein [Phycisphaerales bacterium]
MKSMILGLVGLAALAGTASASDISSGDLVAVGHANIGEATTFTSDRSNNPYYDNTVNFLGQAFANGGAQNQSGNTITRLVADDLGGIHPFFVGKSVTSITFSVANLNATAVSVRARIRFWFADGAGGGPGTYMNSIGYTFNPFTFSSGVTNLTGNLGAGFVLPATKIWAGITFDDNTGTTGATLAQMNNMGVGLFNPPTVGTSADMMFQTTAAGSFFTTNNPAGSLFNFGGAPVANAGWKLIPTPGAAALLGLAGIAASRRRR